MVCAEARRGRHPSAILRVKRGHVSVDRWQVDLFDWISNLIDVVTVFVRGYYWSIFLITGLLVLAMYVAAH